MNKPDLQPVFDELTAFVHNLSVHAKVRFDVTNDISVAMCCMEYWHRTLKGVYLDLALWHLTLQKIPIGPELQRLLTHAAVMRMRGEERRGSTRQRIEKERDAALKNTWLWKLMLRMAYKIVTSKIEEPAPSIEDLAQRLIDDSHSTVAEHWQADTLADYWKRRTTDEQKIALCRHVSGFFRKEKPDLQAVTKAILQPR